MVVATSIIAATAAVVGAGAAVAGAVQSGNAQKKAANQAAATEEENARRAEENAQAWAEANEQQTAFNHAEANLDADIVRDKTARDLAFLTSQKGYQGEAYDRAIGLATTQLTLGTDRIRGDAEDEITALLAGADHQIGSLTRKADQTLANAVSAVLAADTRTGFEQANLESSAADLNTQSQASLRRAGIERALGAAEQLRVRAEGERIAGAVRVQAGKAGVALSGSSLDVMADQAGQAELAALAAKYQADITVDSYVEDARQKGVRAVQLRSQAAQTGMLNSLDAVRTMTDAAYQANELEVQASEVGRQALEKVSTIDRQRDSNLASLWAESGAKIGGLGAERDNTLGNFDDQIATSRLQGEQQEAALRREAEQIKKKGEIDARNIRLTQMAQAADFRASAAARRESGSAAQTAGYLSAGATILGTASKLATQWPTLGGSAAAGSTAYDAAPAAVTDIA
jgi:hypothetical protein